MKTVDLLEEVYKGSIVLPDFQRSFIWEPEDVRELLVSLLGDYFIGSMLVLENFKKDSPFALRLIEGVDHLNKNAKIQSIIKILLDGQQRTSAIFYAFYEPDIPLKNRKNAYRFYLNLEKASKQEWDSAVLAVSEKDQKMLRTIKEDRNILSFKTLRNIEELADRFKGDKKFRNVIKLSNDFMNREIHVVSLSRDTSLEKIVETFERINRTGEPLSIFELLTARLYKDEIKLRDLLDRAKGKYDFLESVAEEFILKVIALLRGKEPRRRNILELSANNFKEDWNKACNALQTAYERIMDLKNGYGVLDLRKWMPYSTMMVPLAGMIYFMKSEKLETPENYRKLDKWYWAAVFSNRYDQAADSKAASDFISIRRWIKRSDKCPEVVTGFNFDAVDLEIDKQSSAIYRGVINMIVLRGAFDFKTGLPPQFGKEKIQDDHIFPKSIYKDHRILNRTLITTNSQKHDKRPSEYFGQLVKEYGEEGLTKILRSHLIPKASLKNLLKDKLREFTEKRKERIISELRRKISGVV